MDIHAAAGIVFDDQRRLLLIRRGREPAALTWSVPGGKCLPGETAEAACVRELAEETGLLVRVDRWAGRIHRPAPGGHRFVIDDFVCTLTGGALRAGDDAVEVGWFDRASFNRLRLAPALASTLAEWQLLPA
ncbi:MAG TPA: NUDIX domain-containing protein [Jatrophihabitans sp.]|nr:NUDIX domain-containing protein [Jatrophihabitans sp.]